MHPELFSHFQKAVRANSVADFDTAVGMVLDATPGAFEQRGAHYLAAVFADLNTEFNSSSCIDSDLSAQHYTKVFVEWLQSEVINPTLLEELFVNQVYCPWVHLLAKDDSPKYFEKIDISRLFSTTEQHCEHPETLVFLNQLVHNNSIHCFTYFLNHDFVAPIFYSKPHVNEGFNWSIVGGAQAGFLKATWEFYTRHIDVIDPQWIVSLIDAIQEGNDTDCELLKEIFTTPAFQKWIQSSDAFHKALLTTPLFSVALYPSVLQWLPKNHHVALRQSVVTNEITRMDPNHVHHINFLASLPEHERIDHFVAAWQWISKNHNNPEILERRYILPALECLSDQDIDHLFVHPWMHNASSVVRNDPRIQRCLLNSVVQHERSPTRNKKI